MLTKACVENPVRIITTLALAILSTFPPRSSDESITARQKPSQGVKIGGESSGQNIQSNGLSRPTRREELVGWVVLEPTTLVSVSHLICKVWLTYLIFAVDEPAPLVTTNNNQAPVLEVFERGVPPASGHVRLPPVAFLILARIE